MSEHNNYKIQEFVAHSTRVNCLSFGPKSNQVLATGGEDTKVNIWRIGNNWSNIWTLSSNKSSVECLCFDSEEQCVVSGAVNGSLKVFDLNEGKLARNLGSHPTKITSIQYHPYGEFVVSGSADCSMKVWDVRNKSCIQTYNGHTKDITCVRFSPDGKWVGSSAQDGQILLWDLVAGKLIHAIKLQNPSYCKLFEFNPTEFTLAAQTSMRTVKFWDLETMESIGATNADSNSIQSIAYSNLGSVLCTAAKDTLKIWELDPNINIHSTIDNIGWDRIEDMKMSNNFQLIAGSCFSNFVSIWSIDLEDHLNNNSSSSNNNNANDEKNMKIQDSNNSEKRKNNILKSPKLGTTTSNNNIQQSRLQYNDDDITNSCSKQSSSYPYQTSPSVAAATVVVDQNYALYESDIKEHRSANHSNSNNNDIKQPSTPEVIWEDHALSSSQEMATSMGESFWRRFKETQSQDKLADDLDSKLTIRNDKKDIGISEKELASLLPPSSFNSNNNINSNNNSNNNINSDNNNKNNSNNYHNHHNVKDENRLINKKQPQITSSNNHNNDLSSLDEVVVNHNKALVPSFPKRIPSNPIHHHNHNHLQNHNQQVIDNNALAIVGMSNDSQQTQCMDCIDKLLADSIVIKSTLSQRLSSLRILRQLWLKGEIMETVEHLLIYDISSDPENHDNLITLADFFQAIELKGNGLNLDCCVKILSILDQMLASKIGLSSEHVVYSVYTSLASLSDAFGELIQSARSVIVTAAQGVDLSREARLHKSNLCHEIFTRAMSKIEILKRQFKYSKTTVELLDIYQSYYNKYFSN